MRSTPVYLLKMVLMRGLGRLEETQTDLEWDKLVGDDLTYLLMRDSLGELNLGQVMQFLSSLIRLVPVSGAT